MNTARKIDSNGSRQADKFVVRFPEDMRDQIAVVARENHRSMNSEIIARLEYSLRQDNVLNQEQPPIKDGNDLSAHERELLQRFRLLGQRQQNALIALIAQDLDPA